MRLGAHPREMLLEHALSQKTADDRTHHGCCKRRQGERLSLIHIFSAAPLVNAEGKAVGFVSDGDIMRYLSKRSTMMMDPVVMIMQTVDADGGNKDFARKLDELMGMQALSIGAKGIIGVDVHADLPEVCRVLGENHLKKVPVLDEGQVVGVINRSDITHYSMEQYLAERGDEALAAGSGEGQGPTKLERAEEAAALPDDEAVASSI